MLFRRRKPERFLDKARLWLWPRVSFRRSFLYFKKRVLRLHATPHAIAAGFAAGVLASFTPFIGFHFLLAFAIAYLIGGNMASAAIGTAVGNPLTFPLIWAITYEFGSEILYGRGELGPVHHVGHALREMDVSAIWHPLLKPMLVGGLPIGLLAGGLSYWVIHAGVKRFQTRRDARLAGISLARAEAALSRRPLE
ncbi:DUF2062 domain-containing protein [Fulvimarina sp. 2208YS6-2-32]|uniref:DUF2062 domain-containing protein n=1 Tax=Fulvimarina uroteuthidis TaxID=3098149 RepID=A0ABU5I574_9HYPH|nr:DUF2062 domain-containing protein [Fulvimarina sp. 2208YS6-2-32]MDY8109311.1 DUF2062 domain-containing protein [Fulvimarina sp. 2208YS6-2-32]